MIPESELVRGTYVIRDMRLPSDVKLTRQSMLRWLALSLGLLTEEESRTTVIPILDAFLAFQLTEEKSPTIKDLSEKSKQPIKAVRYHMNRLVETGLVKEEKRKYSFLLSTHSNKLSLSKSFQEHYQKNAENAMETVKEALDEIQRTYNKK